MDIETIRTPFSSTPDYPCKAPSTTGLTVWPLAREALLPFPSISPNARIHSLSSILLETAPYDTESFCRRPDSRCTGGVQIVRDNSVGLNSNFKLPLANPLESKVQCLIELQNCWDRFKNRTESRSLSRRRQFACSPCISVSPLRTATITEKATR